MKLFGWKSGRDESRPVLSRSAAAGFLASRPSPSHAQGRAGPSLSPEGRGKVGGSYGALALLGADGAGRPASRSPTNGGRRRAVCGAWPMSASRGW